VWAAFEEAEKYVKAVSYQGGAIIASIELPLGDFLDFIDRGTPFVANPFRKKYHPGQKVPVSEMGGTQIEHLIAIFQAPLTGDWWVAYKDEVLGYYPAGLFTKLNGGACKSLWYGEAGRFNSASAKPWPKTEVGSGAFAGAGLFYAAYVRNPKYYDLFWSEVEPPDVFIIGNPPTYKEECYNRSKKEGGVFFLGGPGGKSPLCVYK
jgi:hypothetical protein